jgi:hypothetical protein
MIRDNLLALLKSYNPKNNHEILCKNDITSFVKNNENCFERSLEIGHVTASSWLLDYRSQHALLTHHRKLNKWMQLGGHCDGDSDVLRVSIKEAVEESGIEDIVAVNNNIFDIDIHFIPTNKQVPGHYHYDIRFLLQARNNQPFKISDESNALRWVSKDRSAMPTDDDSVIRMFNKWINL